MGDASSVRLAFSKETTWGVIVATGSQAQRITSVSPKLRANTVQSGEIDPTRQPSGAVRTSKSAELSFGYELSLVPPVASPGTGFDLLTEGAMMSSWSTIVALAAASFHLGAPTGNSFVITGTGTSVVTGWVTGQVIRLSGYSTNQTVYARITVPGTTTALAEGVRATGLAVTAESGIASIAVAGSYIRTAAVKQSYTAQVDFSDLTTPEYSVLSGLRVGTWEEKFTPEGLVAGTFTFQGKTQATATATSLNTPTLKWSTPRINTTDANFKNKMEGTFASTSTLRIAEINFRLDNRLRTDLELGTAGPGDIGLSNPTLEGTIVAYMADGVLLRKYEADTLTKLSWMVDDGTRQRVYSMNNVRLKDASAEATGNDATVRVTIPFSVEPDATGVAFQVDRF